MFITREKLIYINYNATTQQMLSSVSYIYKFGFSTMTVV